MSISDSNRMKIGIWKSIKWVFNSQKDMKHSFNSIAISIIKTVNFCNLNSSLFESNFNLILKFERFVSLIMDTFTVM